MEREFVIKKIKQSLQKYDFAHGWLNEDELYEEIFQLVQRRCSSGKEKLYEIIEDEVYSFMTNA